MNDLRKLLTGIAVVGLLAGGTAPAAASGEQHHHHGLDDKTIKVLIIKKHHKSGHQNVVEYEEKSLEHAVRYAKDRCGDKSQHELWKLAKNTEKYEKKWVEVCSYDHGKNKNIEYHVVFKDNHK